MAFDLETRVDEIARGRLPPVHVGTRDHRARLHLQPVPADRGDEPFLFHTGQRFLFRRSRRPSSGSCRWLGCAGFRSDIWKPTKCGAVNQFLAAAPDAQVIHGPLAIMLSLTDMRDRPPVAAPLDGVHDTGGHRLQFIATPHVPHNWEAGLWFDETTSTLLAGDLFTHTGQCPSLTESDCVAPALEAEGLFHATGLTTNLTPTLMQLAELSPTTLAIMHGASFHGDGAEQLRTLADGYAGLFGAS